MRTFGCALSVLLARGAHADPPAPSGPQRPGRDADPVVVRAPPSRRSAGEIVLETAELRAVPRASATEWLASVPGMVLLSHGGEGKAPEYVLRGFNASHGQDLEVSLGGLPLNEVSNVHGQGYADIGVVPPEVVDRVRVLPGPFEGAQGDFAVAGSARFELGVPQRGVTLRASYGQFNTARALSIVAPRRERRENFAAGELARSDGFGPSRAWARAGLVAQWVLALNDRLSLRALLLSHAQRFDTAGVLREDDLAAGRVGFFDTYDTHQGGTGSRHALLLELAHAGDGRTSVSAFASLRDLRVRENYSGYAASPLGDRYEQAYHALTVGSRAVYARPWALGQFEVGASARHDETTQRMVRLRAADQSEYRTDADADVAATDVGLWAEVLITRPLRGLSLRAAMRADALAFSVYDRLPRSGSERTGPVVRGRRDALGFALGPRASVSYELGRGFTAQLSYGKGFRSPQATTLSEGENAPFATVHAGELGLRFAGARGEASVSGYVTHVDRDLFFDPTQGLTVTDPRASATTRLGASAHVRVNPTQGLTVLASGAFTRGSFDATGLLVPYVPLLVSRIEAALDRPVSTVRGWPLAVLAGASGTFMAYRPLPFAERADPVAFLDVAAGARLGPFELLVAARNLTDARWKDAQFAYASSFDPSRFASLVPARHFSAGRPFTLLVTVGVTL